MEASSEPYQGLLIPETEGSFGTSLEFSRIFLNLDQGL